MTTKHPNRIRYLRDEQGMTQVELAALVGTTQQHLSRIEKGAVKLNVEWMSKFSKALGVAPIELFTNAALAGLEDQVEPLNSNGYGAVAAIAASKKIKLYQVLTSAVSQTGIRKGDIIGVDEEALPKTGDVLLVAMSPADTDPAEGIYRMLWQYVEPSLLLTNRSGYNLVISLDDPMIRAVILGVVIRGNDKLD